MIAFLFPGQGAQDEGLLHKLPAHPEVERTLDEAREVLGTDVRGFDDSRALRSTAVVQQALLIAGVATARALVSERVRPSVVAGLSIGAFAAAVGCETLSFADALRIARLRGELMEAAYPSGYGLAAVEGLDEMHVEEIVRQIQTPELPVYIALVNAPRQLVVGGSDAALDAVTTLARRKGAQSVARLAIAVPSHGPLMESVAKRLVQSMGALRLKPPSVPYVSNRGGRPLYDAEAIREDLATNVAHPVRWYDTLEVMRELGAAVFVEMPPGHVSTHLVSSLFSDVTATAIADGGLRQAVVVSTKSDREGA